MKAANLLDSVPTYVQSSLGLQNVLVAEPSFCHHVYLPLVLHDRDVTIAPALDALTGPRTSPLCLTGS